MKYVDYVRTHFDDPRSPVFKLYELRAVLRLRGISDAYLKRMINYLLKRGDIRRITRGIYTVHDDIIVVGFAFRPFYYGLENALTIRKLWEQGTNPIVITSCKVRRGARKFGDSNYVIQSISKKLLFGYELMRYYDMWVPVSDNEKTLIDFVYFRHYLRDDVIKELRRRVDRKKLDKYLRAYPVSFRNKVNRIIRS